MVEGHAAGPICRPNRRRGRPAGVTAHATVAAAVLVHGFADAGRCLARRAHAQVRGICIREQRYPAEQVRV